MDEDRFVKLGFKPQKEVVYNKLLPYAVKLDEESVRYLTEIKTNLGQAILLREIIPEAMYWLSQLSKYMKLYGRKFSKEDHLQFIHLLYDMLLIPELQLVTVQSISAVLQMLLKKKELISRDDLVLDWRPLYDLYEKTCLSSYHAYGLSQIPSNFESSLKSLIRVSRAYFSVESTQEMLDEWRPMLYPFDTLMAVPLSYMELFFCTKLPPHQHDKGFKLWFDELIQLWQNFPIWDNHFVGLFARLAKDNIGYIDWEPYISTVFSRLMKNLNLPRSTSSNCHTDMYPMLVWIAAMMGNGSSCQKHITHLFKALESYYHPSNFGRWLVKLQKLAHKLPVAVVRRLHRERYTKETWDNFVPDSCKLTDAEITEFVSSLKSVALLQMYSKVSTQDNVLALQNLALLRPELIVPSVIERLYSSLETLTEPHRLTAAIQCVSFMARNFVNKDPHFPEGQTHVVPLLMGSLPGLDPNDMKKCMLTFQFVSMISSLILIVDCSKGIDDVSGLTEIQRQVCLSTAAFEDFVLQFLDKAFMLIEKSSSNNNSHSDRSSECMNLEENIMGVCMNATLRSLLIQCSPDIYKAALQKLYNFISSHIFEVKFAGKYAATLCRAAFKVDAKQSLQLFLPHFYKLVMALTDNDEVLEEEVLDNELLFSLLLLSELCTCDGIHVANYRNEIEQVLSRSLHLKCKDGYVFACTLLRNALKAFTTVYPVDFCSISDFWTRCREENLHLLINEWGKPGNINDIGMKFHIPSDKEIELAKMFLQKFLNPELELLCSWSKGEKSLTREEVQCSLNIIVECISGASAAIPFWGGEAMTFRDSKVPMHCTAVKECGTKNLTFSSEKNLRLHVAEIMKQLLDHVLQTAEDDTKSLLTIIKIYQVILFQWGITEEECDARWKGFQDVKKALGNKLRGRKQHTRLLLVDRVCLQQDLRMLVKNKPYFTDAHAFIMQDIFKLSVSHYGAVRASAQKVLGNLLRTHTRSYEVILPGLLEVLKKDPAIFHEEFKGTLYILASQKQHTMLSKRNWKLTEQLWPALVSAQHSEKPSIIKLHETLSIMMQKNFTTFQIELEVPEKVIERCKFLWKSGSPLADPTAIPTLEEEQQSIERLKQRNSENKSLYLSLVEKLVNLLENGNLHWRQYHLAFVMLLILARYDVHFPPSVVRVVTSNLVHDAVAIRKVAISALNAILKQQKQKHLTRTVDPLEIDSNNLLLHPALEKLLENSERMPNLWLQYSSVSKPDTKEAWEKRHFLHKATFGFNSWPKTLKLYCPDSEQPKIDRSYDELKEEEKPIHDYFSQQEFLDNLIKYHSLEGLEVFDPTRSDLFKGLFRNFGDTFLAPFCEKLKVLVEDKQESCQICAAEIISGIIRGSKHWSFEKVQVLKEAIVPILRSAFKNITHETRDNWGMCISNIFDNRDPNKAYWVLDVMLEEPVEEDSRSCIISNWLRLLFYVLKNLNWRAFEILYRMLDYALPRLNHPYANIRKEIASVLSIIFKYDVAEICMSDASVLKLAPRRIPFIKHILPQLAILEASGDTFSDTDEVMSVDGQETSDLNDSNRNKAKNLLQTVSCWTVKSSSASKLQCVVQPEMFEILSVLCSMKSESTDDDRIKDCNSAISSLSLAHLHPRTLEVAISTLKQISHSGSWRSRAASVCFLRQIVSTNLFRIFRNEQQLTSVKELTLEHMHDERVEVREAAAQTLGGLLHCEVISVSEDLLSLFKKKCRKSMKNRQRVRSAGNSGVITEPPEQLSERHAGILGLCACVSAFPYDVPDFMPDVLMVLSDHVHDTEPIQSTVKKTLSDFKRTHQDSWRDHKLKFTDDQLGVITDLLVSPSYYA